MLTLSKILGSINGSNNANHSGGARTVFLGIDRIARFAGAARSSNSQESVGDSFARSAFKDIYGNTSQNLVSNIMGNWSQAGATNV